MHFPEPLHGANLSRQAQYTVATKKRGEHRKEHGKHELRLSCGASGLDNRRLPQGKAPFNALLSRQIHANRTRVLVIVNRPIRSWSGIRGARTGNASASTDNRHYGRAASQDHNVTLGLYFSSGPLRSLPLHAVYADQSHRIRPQGRRADEAYAASSPVGGGFGRFKIFRTVDGDTRNNPQQPQLVGDPHPAPVGIGCGNLPDEPRQRCRRSVPRCPPAITGPINGPQPPIERGPRHPVRSPIDDGERDRYGCHDTWR